MNRVLTILLVLLVAGVAVFLFVLDPRLTSTREAEARRDHVMHFDPTAIRAIRIASGNDGFEIDRRDDGWWIGPKPKDVASPQMVVELLAAAGSLRVFDIIREGERGGRDLGDFGLDRPKSQIDLIGDGEETLYFGKEAAVDGRVYVRSGGSGDVFVVSDEIQKLAFRNPQDFRDRRLTRISPDRVDGITIKRGAGEIAIERGGRGWEIVRPLRARADREAVEKLIKDLAGVEIASFVADESNDLSAYGLAEPRAEVILSLDGEPRPVALRIGADAGPGVVLAQFTARDSVYHVPAAALEMLQITPDDLRDRRVADLNLDTVDAIRFHDGTAEKLFERAGGGWSSPSGALDDAEISRQAAMLTDARVLEYLPLTEENLLASGLDKPAMKITFDAWLSENTPEAVAGRYPVLTLSIGRQEGGKAWVRVNDDPEICVVPTVLPDVFR